MPKFNIVVFAGDYAGPEVTAEAVKVSSHEQSKAMSPAVAHKHLLVAL